MSRLRCILANVVLAAPLLSLAGVASATEIKPKMNAVPVTDGQRQLRNKDPSTEISSRAAIFTGICSPGNPFSFTLSGGSSRGAIGISSPDSIVSLDIVEGTGATEISGEPQDNFFAGIDNSDIPIMAATPFVSEGVGNDGSIAEVTCSQGESEIIVMFSEDVQSEDAGTRANIVASVSYESDGSQRVVLSEGTTSEITLYGDDSLPGKSGAVRFDKATNKSIKLAKMTGNKKEPAMVQLATRGSNGKLLRKTLLLDVKDKPERTKSLNLKSSEIGEHGDVVLKFASLGGGKHDERMKVTARIAIVVDKDMVAPVVDVTAFVSSKNPEIVCHEAWISAKLNELRLDDSQEWDIVVTDANAEDPESSYREVGKLDKAANTGLGNLMAQNSDKGGHHGRALFARSTHTKEHGITDEMRRGRKPKSHVEKESSLRGGDGRRLSGVHTKILVHGYCAKNGNPFPTSHFTGSIAEFHDPEANRSHDAFARLLEDFSSSFHGCGIIAHSQGGAAALHLKTHYWSCLDHAGYGGSRLIQSVGTPYQGTPLAGNLALLGAVFGAGCGINDDLTYGGASTWLSSIPDEARSEVHYYTTSFEDKWYRIDYCHAATDVLLSDPDDGTTEKSKGQLAGGNNRGHKEDWCHTSGMRDSPQTSDLSRNTEMNTNAKY